MRKTGEVFKRYSGDVEVARQYTGIARTFLGRMKSYLGEGVSGGRQWRLADGTIIRTLKAGAIEIIDIDVRRRRPCLPIPLPFLHGFLIHFADEIVEDVHTLVMKPFIEEDDGDEYEEPHPKFIEYTDKAQDFDADEESDTVDWGVIEIDECHTEGSWYEDEPIAGEVNWFSEDLGPKYLLSWKGPLKRYFPVSMSTFVASPNFNFSSIYGTKIYYGGFVLTEAPAPVLGAAFHYTEPMGNDPAVLKVRAAVYSAVSQFKLYEAELPSPTIKFESLRNSATGLELDWQLVQTVDLETGYKLNTSVLFSQDASKVCYVARGPLGAGILTGANYYRDSRAYSVEFATGDSVVVQDTVVEQDGVIPEHLRVEVMAASAGGCGVVLDETYVTGNGVYVGGPLDGQAWTSYYKAVAGFAYYSETYRTWTNADHVYDAGGIPPVQYKAEFPLAVDFDANTPVVMTGVVDLSPGSVTGTQNFHEIKNYHYTWVEPPDTEPPSDNPCDDMVYSLPMVGDIMGPLDVLIDRDFLGARQFEYWDVINISPDPPPPDVSANNPTYTEDKRPYRIDYKLKIDALEVPFFKFLDRGNRTSYIVQMDSPPASQADTVIINTGTSWTGDIENYFGALLAVDLRKPMVLTHAVYNVSNTASERGMFLYDGPDEIPSPTASVAGAISSELGTFPPPYIIDPQIPVTPAGRFGLVPESKYLVFSKQTDTVKLLRLKDGNDVLDFYDETKVPSSNDSIDSVKTL